MKGTSVDHFWAFNFNLYLHVDQVCRLWSLDTGLCIGQYSGHSGSVNGVSFNPVSTDPNDFVVATASGDYTVHVWKYSLLGIFLTFVQKIFSNFARFFS